MVEVAHPGWLRHEARAESQPVTVLAAIGWPGDEATGPVQSLLGLAGALAGEFRFKVLARERSFGQQGDSVKPESWVRHGPLDILWCRMTTFGPSGFSSIMRSNPHDILMLNGFFDPEFTIPALILRRLGLVPRRPTILAPRGEFSAGALDLKRARKQAYLLAARGLGLVDDVWLHATSEQEADEIRSGCAWARNIVVAPNIRTLGPLPQAAPRTEDSRLRIVFLSRIDRKKNLDYAIRVLSKIRTPVTFDIFGPVNDTAYWTECEELMRRLPAHVEARHRGSIRNANVPSTLAGYDLFLLPTRGENFGHAIFDALEVGLPVLISDQTPWRDLERIGAGWSLPLADPDRFASTIDRLGALEPSERDALRRAARSLAEVSLQESDAVARTRAMLIAALSHTNDIGEG